MSASSPWIETVSDTALAVAYARALETERPDALFADPFARSLAGQRGKQIYHQIQGDRSVGWLVISRTCILDKLILQSIQAGVDTVLNLAAGLDTRPYRMALPASLRWIEADLSGILTYKQKQLANAQPVCRLEQFAVDLTSDQQRQELFATVNNVANQTLVITEGLLVYLAQAQVEAIATHLYRQPCIHRWLTDLVSPLAAAIAQVRMSQQPIAEDVQLRFAPNNASDFFRRHGWHIQQETSLWHEAHRLQREIPLGNLLRHCPAVNIRIAELEKEQA